MQKSAAVFLFTLMYGGCGTGVYIDHAPGRTAPEPMTVRPFYEMSAKPFSVSPTGLTPAIVKKAYNLPDTGGSGTIAIVDAYDASTVEADLNVFSAEFGLSECTTANGCFEKHKMDPAVPPDPGWSLEANLDTQWAHAIAPDAKILLIEATSAKYVDMHAALDYARARSDVVAVSMSWGGGELTEELTYEKYFMSDYDMVFFAAAGDWGIGTGWPAVSPRVIAVGGTHLSIRTDGTFNNEYAWHYTGGGISFYEPLPDYQKNFSGIRPKYNRARNENNDSDGLVDGDLKIARQILRRAIPDVSYHADQNPGFAVYMSFYGVPDGWYEIGGTSAGSPQWAAIHALGHSVYHENLYGKADGADYSKAFRDITVGKSGTCGEYCWAKPGYDFLTGLGSPLTIDFK